MGEHTCMSVPGKETEHVLMLVSQGLISRVPG